MFVLVRYIMTSRLGASEVRQEIVEGGRGRQDF